MSGGRVVRVCFHIGYYPPEFGGHGLLTERTLPYLARLGVESMVLTRRLPADQPSVGRVAGVHRVLSRGSGVSAAIRRTREVGRFLRREGRRIDVFHTVVPGWETVLNIPALGRQGLPFVYEMMLLGANDPTTVAKLKLGSWRLKRLQKAAAWTGVSAGFRPAVDDSGFPADRFRVVHGGVDIGAFHPVDEGSRMQLRERFGIPAAARVAITVGSLVPRKGIDRVVNGWIRSAPIPGRDLLLVVGPVGAEDRLSPASLAYGAAVRSSIDRAGLSATVRFTGRVENVAEHLAASDYFIFLSRREGLGLVVPEAMASGLPCLVSPLDGIAAEMVEEGVSGRIVGEPDNADSVATAILEMRDNELLRGCMGPAARERAAGSFSLERRATALAELYRAILGVTSSRVP